MPTDRDAEGYGEGAAQHRLLQSLNRRGRKGKASGDEDEEDHAEAPHAVVFCGKLAICRAHYGRALKLFGKANEERPSKWLDGIVVQLYERLGWTHVVGYQKNWSLVKHPKDYRLF